MDIVHKEFSFPSRTGVCTIYAGTWQPEGALRGVVQIHHGMAEYSGRYEAFAKYLCGRGYAVYIHDMANHGKSNQNPAQTGYFGDKDGWKGLIADMKAVYDIAKEAHPDVPYIIFGHSMGSFVARCFAAKYGHLIDGAIFCGTAGRNPLASVSSAATAVLGAVKGKKAKLKFLADMSFSGYNDKFEKRTEYDWLSRDEAVVDAYVADDMCGFLFTVQGYSDLGQLLTNCNTKAWYAAVPAALPICLIGGDMDPVGNYGAGVEEVCKTLQQTGHERTVMKLYGNARHELLNETNKESVYEDIAVWIENTVEG
ncbi:MAG: alpha/beta hydrolase [Clostridiales bacterium]|nr:alpha/beta hydrolase [Clostridiales bacterium]